MATESAESLTETVNGSDGDMPVPDSATTHGDISVREAVRRAVAELGADAELDDVLAHIQSKYGLCPPRGTAQSYLSLA